MAEMSYTIKGLNMTQPYIYGQFLWELSVDRKLKRKGIKEKDVQVDKDHYTSTIDKKNNKIHSYIDMISVSMFLR